MNAIDEMACCNLGCDNGGKPGLNIVGHGWFATKSGRRRRYRCTICGQTLSTNTGTAYRGLWCSRREFDQVASLRVEGVSISATARVTAAPAPPSRDGSSELRQRLRASTSGCCGISTSWSSRLMSSARSSAAKSRPTWLFATIEVWSRLWAGSVLGPPLVSKHQGRHQRRHRPGPSR